MAANNYYPPNMFRVCVEENTNNIEGYVVSPLTDEKIFFSDIAGLLLKMDKLFDQVGYPQAFQKKRTFLETDGNENSYRGIPSVVREKEEILNQQGKKGTYDILVRSRRNTTWQGFVFNLEHEKLGSFVGDVDLLEILTRLQK